jgi:hypothetical protein
MTPKENAMRFQRLLAASLAGATLVFAHGAFAHGAGEPKHGGAVATANDLAFELAPGADGATLYVEDHGKPFATAGMSGRLTVLNGAERSEAKLEPAGENRMRAKGVKVAKGSKSVAHVTLPDKKELSVRFSQR